MRIGRASESISKHYESRSVFNDDLQSGEIFSNEFFANNLRILLHRDSFVDSARPSSDALDEEILICEGREEATKFLDRLKTLLRWGNFFWRLSDLEALKLEAKRVIKPIETEEPVELKVHWNLKLNPSKSGCFYYYIDGMDVKMNLKSLYNVQRYRLFRPTSLHAGKTDKILYTGISRYVFSPTTGLCKELRVERIEPKISGIDWKWKLPTNTPAFD